MVFLTVFPVAMGIGTGWIALQLLRRLEPPSLRIVERLRNRIFLRKIRREAAGALPGFLQTAASALSAGLSLEAAWENAARRAGGLQDVLLLVRRRAMLEGDWAAAAEEAGRILRSAAWDSVFLSLRIAKRSGSSLGPHFQRLAQTARRRRQAEDRLAALTQPSRTSALFAAGVPVFLLLAMAVAAPEMSASLFHTSVGRWTLLLCAGWMGLGAFGMSRILRRARGEGGSRKARRRAEVLDRFPEFLETAASAMEAGLDFRAALSLYLDETEKSGSACAVRSALERIRSRLAAGEPLADCLETSAEDLPEWGPALRAAAAASKSGAAMAAVLRSEAECLRQVRLSEAEKAAGRASVWILLPLVVFFLPAIFLILLVPAFLAFGGAGGSG